MLTAADSSVKLRKSSRLATEEKREETVQKKSKVEMKTGEAERFTRSKAKVEESAVVKSVPTTPIRKSPRKSSTEQSPIPSKSSEIEVKAETPAKKKSEECDYFSVAKRAFHRSGAFKIVGRVEEKAELTSFWYDRVSSGKGASIYISGNPGTGKTALVDELIPELIKESSEKIKLIKINCMMLKDPLKAFQEIADIVNVKSDKNVFLTLSALESYFSTPAAGKMFHVIIIDEVDQIGMKDPELLCRLLAMPYLPDSKVIIFGIANSMDLTERFLPRLKLLNCEPAVLHFPQYTIPDITAILFDRLERINSASSELGRPFMDKSAIELTARKVASTGDLRRALDMLRQAIDLAEDEYKLSVIDKAASTGALVKLTHVAKIMDKFGNAQSGPLVLLKSLNLHQKVILAAIIGFVSSQTTGNSHLTIQKLYEEYCTAASRPPKLYDPVTRSEFIDLISNLESMSLLGKSTTSTASTSESGNSVTDLWKLKVYLLVPNELVKTMISQELPSIKILFGIN